MEHAIAWADDVRMARKHVRISLGPPKKHFIKEWRKYRGLTQEQLGGRLDVSTSHISQIERGTINYTRETLEAIAYALQCEPADLLGRDPSQPDYQLWKIITGLKPEQQEQALRVVRALAGEAA